MTVSQENVANSSLRAVEKPRPINRLRIKVGCARVGMQVLPGGGQVHGNVVGTQATDEAIIYEDEMNAVEALVEDQSKIQEAREMCDHELKAWIAKGESYSGDPRRNPHNEQTFAGSVPASFHKRFGRNMRPLDFVEILETLPPPADEVRRNQSRALMQEFGPFIKEVVGDLVQQITGASAQAAGERVEQVLQEQIGSGPPTTSKKKQG